MRDPNDDDDIDRAYRRASAAAEDPAAAQRRRAAVLQAVGAVGAVGALDAAAPDAPAALAAAAVRARPTAAWQRGAVAACVIVASALVVTQVRDEPAGGVSPGPRADAPMPVPAQVPAQVPAPMPASPAGLTATTTTTTTTTATPTAAAAPAASPPLPPAVSVGAAPADAATEAAPARPPATRTLQPLPAPAAAAPESDALARSSPGAITQRSAFPDPEIVALPSPLRAAPPVRMEAERPPPALRPERTAVPLRRALADTAPGSLTDTAPGSLTAAAAARAQAAGPGPAASGLLAAVASGDLDAVRQALRNTGTDPDAERDAEGRTALALAVLRADLPLVKLLLARRANPLAPDRYGRTPQGYAEASGDPALVQALVQALNRP